MGNKKDKKTSILKKWKKQKGVTLISLVVTIVVMVVLASVSLNAVIGDNGIITQAQQATVKSENATVLESLSMKASDIELEYYSSDEESLQILENLKTKGYINDDNIVNVDSITTANLRLGKGSDNKDVYKLERNVVTNDYELVYYNDKGISTNLGSVFEAVTEIILEPTPASYFDFNPETGSISPKNADSYYWTAGDFPVTEIVIPEEIDGVKVTSIGNEYQVDKYYSHTLGFSNLNNVTSIYIPGTIENMSNTYYGAFRNCKNLKTVIIGKGVKNIGTDAFYGCSSLTNITIPNSVTTIEYAAFGGCSSLKNITIPSSVTTMRLWSIQ